MTDLRAPLTIGILTYRRPEMLHRSLPLVLDQTRALTAGGTYRARVLVVDNDPTASARATVAEFGPDEVDYVVEPQPGISAARNRAMDECGDHELLVFLDDDEQPHTDWLAALIKTWEMTQPAAVVGRVVSQFEHQMDPWVAAGEFFERPRMPTGTSVHVAATGNLLLDLRQVRRIGVRFSERLGLSGGEDTLFSRELVAHGARLIWCDESVADDFVAAERLTRGWLLTRAWSQGNTASVVELALVAGSARRTLTRVGLIGQGASRVAFGAARWLYGRSRSWTSAPSVSALRHDARGQRTVRRGLGMIAGALGIVYHEYAREGTSRRFRFRR